MIAEEQKPVLNEQNPAADFSAAGFIIAKEDAWVAKILPLLGRICLKQKQSKSNKAKEFCIDFGFVVKLTPARPKTKWQMPKSKKEM